VPQYWLLWISESWLPSAGAWLLLALVLSLCIPAVILMPRRRLADVARRDPTPERWPRVSVIIAARDEGQRIGQALASHLASDYPDLEVVLANDRSTDATGSIAAELAARDSRLRIITITELPDGWLGKTHAMSLAAKAASGEWLLFTDGDVLFEPGALRLSMQHALVRRCDHFCLLPSMETDGWMERVLVSFFAMLFTFGSVPWLRNLRVPHAYYGVGAFNLVRRAAYDSVGGHDPIRLDVLDDVKLGKLLFRHRIPADWMVAGPLVRVRWQDSAWGVIRGLEKNAFASMGYSVVRLTVFSVLYLCVFVLPWVWAIVGRFEVAIASTITLVVLHFTLGRMASLFGGSWSVMPGLTPGALGVLAAFWRSAFLTLRRRGIVWRETFYPLDRLRREMYR